MTCTIIIMADDHVVRIDFEQATIRLGQRARLQAITGGGDRTLVWDESDTLVLDYGTTL